jgi:hypothetical protein
LSVGTQGRDSVPALDPRWVGSPEVETKEAKASDLLPYLSSSAG